VVGVDWSFRQVVTPREARALFAEVLNTADLKVTVDSKATSTAISGDFKRDFEYKEGGATATYTLNVKMCNPACKR
jgi:hypothetical protein